MTKLSSFNNTIKKYYLFLLGPIVFFYIGFHLINGNNGLLAHVYLNEDIKNLESSIYNISKDNEIIQLKIAELQSNKNSDIRDEMVRKILNFSQDDEYTIIFD
jgi:cell division protein FtsB